jgi:hypothetical protein
MNILVEHIDTAGNTYHRVFQMSKLAFVKHLAIAGQGYAPKPQKLLRTIGMFFHYSYYIHSQAFNNDRFSEPPTPLSDPTEKGQFSNLAGKAIADFLSKRIDNSLFTVNYEAVMRIQGHLITGQRPDLISYSPTAIFSLEAKGRHQNSPGNMLTHKTQAQTGPIPVNFSIACVSYNLFNQVTCKYHDPFNDNVPYDNSSLQALTRNYYKGLIKFLDQELFEYIEFQFQGESFYEVVLSNRNLESLFLKEFPLLPFWFFVAFEEFSLSIILPRAIREYAEIGITNETKPFIFENSEQNNNLYIDNDRVGLRIMGY